MNDLKLLIAIGLILVSCQKDNFDIDNLNGNKIGALGHGGMGFGGTYAFNSFESIFNCLSIGADGSELDIQMTKDSVLIAFHNVKLEDSAHNNGNVYKKNWDEIKNTTYIYPLLSAYKIITVDELFTGIANLSDQLDQTDYTFFFDCKNYDPDDSETYLNRFNNALISLIDKHDLADNVFIEFKRVSLMKSLKNKRPDLRVFAGTDFDTGMQIADEIPIQGITIAREEISKEQVKMAHDRGLMIAVFDTDNKDDNIDAINKNVDFIQSDKIKHLIRILK